MSMYYAMEITDILSDYLTGRGRGVKKEGDSKWIWKGTWKDWWSRKI